MDPAPRSVPPAPPGETTDRRPPSAQSSVTGTQRLAALIEVVLCSGAPTQILLFSLLSFAGMRPREADGAWSPPFVIIMSMMDMILLLGLVILFLRAHRESLPRFLFGSRRVAGEALLGLALVPAAFLLIVLVLALVLTIAPHLHNVPVNPFERLMSTPGEAVIFSIVVIFAGGVREEIQRAFIIRRFDQYLGGGVLGILLFSVVFGAGHVEQGYAAAIATTVLGAGWGWVYWRRRSVVAPVVSHAGFNLAQLLKYVAVGTR